jgi:hypothetical protein
VVEEKMAFRVMNQVEEECGVIEEFAYENEILVYCDGDIVKEFEF